MTLTELVELLRSFFPRRLPKEYYERTIEVWTVGTIQSKDFCWLPVEVVHRLMNVTSFQIKPPKGLVALLLLYV